MTVSGGFAVVQPESIMTVNAVEAYPLEDFSADAVRSQIAESQKVASGNGSEVEIATAKIELEVSFMTAHVPGVGSVVHFADKVWLGPRELAGGSQVDQYRTVWIDQNRCGCQHTCSSLFCIIVPVTLPVQRSPYLNESGQLCYQYKAYHSPCAI